MNPKVDVPRLLTVTEAADVLRTSRAAIYAMVARQHLPGVVRLGRRVLICADRIGAWLDDKSDEALAMTTMHTNGARP